MTAHWPICQCRRCSSMKSMIPPSEYNRILQTKSSPRTIAVLLNEAENLYSKKPLHWNAKRRYPFWRACPICDRPFAVANSDEYHKKNHCSQKCATETSLRKRKGKPHGPRKDKSGYSKKHQRKGKVITCPVCGTTVYKPRAWLKKVKTPTCSRQCNGILRGEEFAKYAHKGRAGWTDASMESYLKKMTGPNNPSWKGGVTYFRKKGHYGRFSIKYVRCPDQFLPMARKDGYVMEHRLIVAQRLGRCLKRSEVVHHKDHNPENNSPDNLMLFTSNSAHKKFEATGSPKPLWQL